MASALATYNKESYGVFELKRLYPKYYFGGLSVAVTVHIIVLMIYLLFGTGRNVVDRIDPFISPYGDVKVINLRNFEAPTILPQNVGARITSRVITDGVPVPVKNYEADPTATIKSTEERRDANPLQNVLGEGDKIVLNSISQIADESEYLPGKDEFIPVEQYPEPVVNPKPVYPQLAINAGIFGTVHVKALIDKNGKVINAFILKSASEILNQSALDAAMKSVFTPALQNKHAVAVWIVLKYNFNLQDQ